MENKFKLFAASVKDLNLPVHGMQFYQNAKLIGEFGNCDNRFPIYSITKSIVSLAVGIAEKEGLVKLNNSVLEYIPEEYLRQISQQQLQVFSSVSIHRLLTMSFKGFDFRPSGNNWLLHCLNTQINPQKEEFHYTNICAYLVSVALTNAVKMPLQDYIQEKIFDPLKISKPAFVKSPEGYFNGASGLELNVSELAKIGQLIMDNGTYNGKIIIPESYTKRATAVQIQNRDGGYGYFIWKYLSGFYLSGKWGQKCYCIPEKKLVLSILSNFENSSDEILKKEVLKFFTE